AFIWDNRHGMRRLQDALSGAGAPGLTGWTLRAATTISADGALIAGFGDDPLGRSQAFLARLPRDQACYADCDGSGALSVADFVCFLQSFAGGLPYANCDGSTSTGALSVGDFVCFQQRFAAGCP